MRPAYRIKQDKGANMEARLEVCIGCGAEQTVFRPKFMPVANPTSTQAPSWFECHVLKLHFFVDISKVEKT